MKSTAEFTIAATTDWQVARCQGLGARGFLVNADIRLAAAGTGGNLEVRLCDGPYADNISSAAADAIPLEEMAWVETGITLAPSTTAITTVNVSAAANRAVTYKQGLRMEEGGPQAPLLLVRGDGVLAGDVKVVLRAQPMPIAQ